MGRKSLLASHQLGNITTSSSSNFGPPVALSARVLKDRTRRLFCPPRWKTINFSRSQACGEFAPASFDGSPSRWRTQRRLGFHRYCTHTNSKCALCPSDAQLLSRANLTWGVWFIVGAFSGSHEFSRRGDSHS